MKIIRLFICCLFLAIALCANAQSLPLFQKGTTDYTIVLAEKPTVMEQSAAKELKTYLEEITGITWNIASEKEVAETVPQIVIGSSDRAKKLFPEINIEKIPYDGIVMKTSGKNLLLTGHPLRGPLYAVDTFLEDVLGVKWWTSTEQFVPKKDSITVAKLDFAYNPKLIYRETYYCDPVQNGVFATRMKCNGALLSIPEELGGHHRFQYFVHSFFPLIPPEKYFAEHPEWYSEIGGERKHERAQLCLTNEEMRKELTKNALEALRGNPTARFISISQNDWYGFCECEKCTKMAQEEESQSGPLIAFINAVAEDIEKEFPEVFVETLAYQYTRKPPKTLKPRDNVIIRLCTIECCFAQPLTGEHNKSLCDDMEGWSKIAKQLFVWDYVTNFTGSMLPHPNMLVLEPNIRFFVDNGTIGLFEQGDAYCSAGDFVRLRNWVISHLMWDQELDPIALGTEFLEGYYGPKAAPLLFEYLSVLHNRVAETGIRLGCFRRSTADWLDFETITEATKLFNRAIEETTKEYGSDSPYVERLLRDKLTLDYVWLRQYGDFWATAQREKEPFFGPADPYEGAVAFFALCDKHGVRALKEYDGPNDYEEYKVKTLKRMEKLKKAIQLIER
ncbi:MAG: DUF4838 domain-containing protein [Thermoguttaceae bacterium]